MIISRTPFRISFFGGGTDYPSWYKHNGGAVLATSINKYCYLTCRYLPPFFDHRIRIVYSKIEDCETIDQIQHPVVKASLLHRDIRLGMEIHHDGDLPARSGMGTSSSFTVGLLHALSALKGEMASKRQLAEESIFIERDVLQETVGCQDQVLASYGGFNHVVFEKTGNILINPVTVHPDKLSELNDNLLLFYTGIQRSSSEVASTYANTLSSKDQQMQEISDMVNEGISILAGNSSIEDFGKLLNHGWQSKRAISPSVSNPEIDLIYENAIRSGAVGGKLLGAGGGGFILICASPNNHGKIKDRLNQLTHVPFRFDSTGTQIILFDPEEDYSDEDRVRADRITTNKLQK
ncbi:MAG: kinase [Chloroflexi bacterium]|nr:kinase [Chloroflexota bacterium]|tara:strand:+ start:7408 stop:8457 length:1050 start_codon:yes stop_codon:yes gene_type:complete